MEKACLPAEFQQSYLDYLSYPRNLILSGTKTYHSTLETYKDRLDAIEADLCLTNEKDVLVPIRDLHGVSGNEVDKCNIHTEDKLDQWLGAEIDIDEADIGSKSVRATRDPKCRFIYIHAEHSRDQLRITRRMLAQILTHHQVMPVYLDFIFVFGAQSDPRDLRFSGFREQTMIKDPPRGLAMLGRSGRQFQLCYNLKGVTLNKNNKENNKLSEWSIRQAAIHHQFDVVNGTTLWIVTKGRLDIQQRFKQLTGRDGRPEDKSFGDVYECFRSSMAAHLMYCHWSTEDWRWYIRWLEDVIDSESSMAICGLQGPGYAHQEYKSYHIQDLQYWKDKTSEAVMVLESNVDVMTALRGYYVGLKANKYFSLKEGCEEDIDSFAANIDEIIDGLRMHISRAKLLAGIISDRKELVLHRLQGQTVARTEQLNLNLEKEAIVMRIITIVTLLYLPATFVSTFFSTDIIKYQNPNGGSPGPGIFSSTAMTRWLQITLPLTAVTIFIAWLTYKSAERARQRRDEQPAQTYRYSPKAAESTAWLSFGVPWGGTMPILPLHNDEKRAS